MKLNSEFMGDAIANAMAALVGVAAYAIADELIKTSKDKTKDNCSCQEIKEEEKK